MKKVLAMVVVTFTTLASTYALDLHEYKVFYKLNNESTFKSLNRYLNLNDYQQKNLKVEFELTEERLRQAIQNENENAAEEAMNFNLNRLRETLSPEQYHKFVLALNVSIANNRDFTFLAAE